LCRYTQGEVARVVDAADAKACAMADALRDLVDELPSAEAAAGAHKRRPLATDRAVDTARKLVAAAGAIHGAPAAARPSSVPCESTSGRESRGGMSAAEDVDGVFGGDGGGGGRSSRRSVGGRIGISSRDAPPSPLRADEEDAPSSSPSGQVVPLPRVDSLKKQNRRPASGHAVPTPRSRARALLG
jgi:hypothetical protein